MTGRDPFGESSGAGDSRFEDVLGETWDGPDSAVDRRLRSLAGAVTPMGTPAYGFERVVLRARRRRQRKIMMGATAVVTGIAVAAGGVVLGFRSGGDVVQSAGCPQGTTVMGIAAPADPARGRAVIADAVPGNTAPGRRVMADAAADSTRAGLGREASMQRRYEWAIGGVLTAAALAGGIFAGCSSDASNKNQAGNTPSAQPSQAPTGTAIVLPPSSAAPSASPSPSASGNPRCHTADLSPAVAVVNGSQAAGHESMNLTLTNTSGHPCTIFGYPGMMLQDQNGNGQATNVTRNRSLTPKTLTLANGSAASTTVRFDFDMPASGEPATGPCEPMSYGLLITPPNETTQLTSPIGGGPVTVCEKGTLDVLPFIAGTTGPNQ
jgi:hypothetical protein